MKTLKQVVIYVFGETTASKNKYKRVLGVMLQTDPRKYMIFRFRHYNGMLTQNKGSYINKVLTLG